MKLLPKDINYRPFYEASKERLEKVYSNSPNKNARGKNNLYLSQEIRETHLSGNYTVQNSPADKG